MLDIKTLELTPENIQEYNDKVIMLTVENFNTQLTPKVADDIYDKLKEVGISSPSCKPLVDTLLNLQHRFVYQANIFGVFYVNKLIHRINANKYFKASDTLCNLYCCYNAEYSVSAVDSFKSDISCLSDEEKKEWVDVIKAWVKGYCSDDNEPLKISDQKEDFDPDVFKAIQSTQALAVMLKTKNKNN